MLTDGVTDPHQEVAKVFRDLRLGCAKVFVLHHASREPIYGAGITDALARHGYQLSTGTLYPVLHTLADARLLERHDQIVDGKIRKYYNITPLGCRVLDAVRTRTQALVYEVGWCQSDRSPRRPPDEPSAPRREAGEHTTTHGK